MNQRKHISRFIPLDRKWREPDSKAIEITSDKHMLKALKHFLSIELAQPKNCPNCGGLIPELSFTFKGKTYFFACYMITEDEKVIAQTDYRKFAKYYNRLIEEKKE